ncbi:MAG: RHS repeat-associated core domain-containing protein, partial [Cyclobacteriaceae bacterium]
LSDGFHAKATDVDSVFSISPGNVDIVIPTQNLTAYEAFQHLYLFDYDERRRLIRKKVPGADWEFYAYDQWDRLVLSQGAHMRENGLTQYNFIKYDQWNRPVMSGVVSIAGSIETIRADLMSPTGIRYESTTPTGEIGYTVNATYPTTVVAGDVHNVAYFDDYNFPDQATYDFVPGAGYTASAYQDTAITSLMTGARIRILDGSGGWLRAAYYYDYKYRPIHSVSDNATGGIDHAYQFYAFRGVVEKSVLIHNATAATPLKVTREYSYDHMDRLLSVTHQMGDNATDKVTLASYDYNELGQVITQNLHQANGETDYLQQMDLRYHIHGQLTSINDPDNPSANNGRLNDVFALKLDYDQGFEQPQYSGQVAGATWYNRSHMEESPATATFGYVYDTRQQVRMADYSGADDYTTRVTEYDQNGNIKALERQGKTEVATGMIDQLQYDYLANQLQSVDDQSTLDGGYTDGASNTLELEYDNSGNLTRERNKGVNAVTYNHMNLPTRIELADSRAIEYIYNGSGARLRAEYYEGTEMVRKITYAGQFYYEDDALSQVFTETGRIVNDDNGRASGSPDGWDGVDYQYMLADHLGNARVVLSSIAERHVTVVATHEGERLTEEAMVFDNLELRDNSQQQYDHTQFNTNVSTSSPDYSYVKLDGQFDQGDERYNNIGTMAMLQVQGGDAIDVKAYAKYNSGGAKNNVGVDGIVSGLVNAFGFNPNSSESGVVLDLFEQANGALGALVAGTGNSDEPEAYLQYLFFDKDFNFVNTVDVGYAYVKVGSAAAVDPNSPVGDHEELHLTRTFTEDGYIFIFVSNSSTGIDVFFDDLTIDYTMNPIDQANDYYPFGGLMGSGFERIISKTNDFRYQGKEYDKDLQWYDFHARQYDPYLGRFLAADPLMQFSSPYNGMGNNPMNLIDPTGMGAYGPAHDDNIAEPVDPQDDPKNEDKQERMVSAADALNNFAQFDSWLAGMNSSGPSFHSGLYGVGNGSYGSGSHQGYVSSRGQVAQAKKAAQLLGGTYSNGAVNWYSTSGNAYYSNNGSMAGGIMVSEHQINVQQAGFLGDDVFSTTGTLLGLKGLVIDDLSGTWGEIGNKQQWKKSYDAHKALKSRGINVKTSTIKAAVPGVLKNVGRGIGVASGLVTVGDIIYNSELKPSHILDATVTGLSFIPGAGWAIGGGYLILDVGSRTFTDKGIGDHLDTYYGGAIYDWGN